MANGIKNKKNKVGYMIFSVIAAIVIWVMVAYTTDPDVTKTLYSSNIRFAGEAELKERGYVVTGIDKIPDLPVKVSGKRSDMLDAMDNIIVEFDVSEINGAGEYSLQGKVILPNSRIYLEKIKFEDVTVSVDKYKEKEIPIEIRQIGNYGDKLVKSEADRSTVLISGAENEVDSVKKGYVTIDLEKIKGDGEVNTNFVMANETGAFITKNETIETATPNILVKNTVYEKAELNIEPVLDDNLKDRYVIDKEKTEISPDKVIVGVLPNSNFQSVTVRIDSASSDEREYELTEENGMYIPQKDKKVKVQAAVYHSNTMSKMVNITPKNVGEGLIVTGELNILTEFYGEENDINNVTAYVDLSGLNEGTYILPVYFEGNNVLPVHQYNAEIVISK